MKYLFFSKDRPMQLELALDTCKHFSVDWNGDSVTVLYAASSKEYSDCYQNLSLLWKDVEFIQESNFRANLMEILSKTKYIMFVVDDCIFTANFSTRAIISALESEKMVLGFSLRLGKNTTYCYPLSIENSMPQFRETDNGMLEFIWAQKGIGDFYYPLEVSSSAYKASDIFGIVSQYNFSNPNTFEYLLSLQANKMFEKPLLFCYDTSIAFCNPINKVQNINNNRSGNKSEYSPEKLLEKYKSGYKIDETSLRGFVSNSCHQEVKLVFCKR